MKQIHWLLIAATLMIGIFCGYFLREMETKGQKQAEMQRIQQSFEKAAQEPVPKTTPFHDSMLNN